MKYVKILNGILALLVIGGVLLLSDLENRIGKQVKRETSVEGAGQYAIKGRTYKIGVTYFAPEVTFDQTMDGLWSGMKALGFVKDSNLKVISQHANAEIANLQPIHLYMDNQDVDVIVVTSTPGITAAISGVKKHPMVFTMTYTPLEAGAGKSYTDHLPNITGVGSFPPVQKTFDFILEILPNTKRIGTVYNSSEANSRKVIQVARDYLKTKGIELIETTMINTSEVHQAVSSVCMQKIDVMWVTGDNTAIQAMSGIIKVCRDNKIPLILNDIDYVKQGALAGVGIGWFATGSHSASYVARVLNGESPAKIPIENYVEEEIIVNKEVAKKLNIRIPEKYLAEKKRVDTVKTSEGTATLPNKKFKLCLVIYNENPLSEDVEKGIRSELKKQGLIEGKNFSLKVLNAQGDVSTLNSIVGSLSSENYDLIFASSTPTIQLLSKKITKIPLVFTNCGDPIKAGLGTSYKQHLANVTGISTTSDFAGMMKLVTESMPGIKTIGTIYTTGEINSVAYEEELQKAGKKQGLRVISVPVSSASEVADASLSIINQGIQAFTQIADNLTASSSSAILKAAGKAKIPYFGFITDQASKGAVACLARDYTVAGSDAVKLALQILSGKSPASLPFQNVSRTSVTVNKEMMKSLKMNIPEKYMQ
ncbi:MAG: ABC transporter substrate-binding protein [Bacteroidota bacterium]